MLDFLTITGSQEPFYEPGKYNYILAAVFIIGIIGIIMLAALCMGYFIMREIKKYKKGNKPRKRTESTYSLEEQELVENYRELNCNEKKLVNDTIKTLLNSSEDSGQNKK